MDLRKIDKEIGELQEQFDEFSDTFARQSEKSNGYKVRYKNILERLGKAIVGREGKEKISKIEEERAILDNEFDRFSAAWPEIEKKILQLELELQKKKELRNHIIGDLAVVWLRQEAEIYDKNAEATIMCIKRLIVGYRLLMDCGAQDVYRQTIGPAFKFLPHVRLPIIKGFNATNYNSNTQFQAGRKIFDQVIQEIERGV